MKPTMTAIVTLFFLELLAIPSTNIGFSGGSYQDGCIRSERQALLRFKQDLNDSNNKLESWIPDGDCCTWYGVFCDNFTGHVLKLRLSKLSISGHILSSFEQLPLLTYVDLSGNHFTGSIPSSIGNLSSLKYLQVSSNQLTGSIPLSIGNLSSLESLDVSHNNLTGSIPLSIGKLSSLEYLDLSFNNLIGSLFPIHFVNLTRLSVLGMGGNSLMMKVYPDWVPPFQLSTLEMQSCHLGPQFPKWLLSQHYLHYLDISNTGIVDTIPSKFWESASPYGFFHFSNNQIYGLMPNLTRVVQVRTLDLSWNDLSSSSLIPSNVSILNLLDLSNNLLSGSMFHSLCYEMNRSRFLQILNLENNFLSGELPDCWRNWESLSVLKLNNNKFTGGIPISLGSLDSLFSLHLCKNSFSGMIPVSFSNLTLLENLGIRENEFVGNIPEWIGERLSSLRIVNFRSNKFHGPFPLELCYLPLLQILDLAHNNLSGTIPRCINNLSNMVIVHNLLDNSVRYHYDVIGHFDDDAQLLMKGKINGYNSILNLVRFIDLSNNKFSGKIPIEVTDLKALQSLNLSYNLFIGRIPNNIGAMRSLESIDFSNNHLYGEIPQSMSSLSFLNYLNLSNNNLIGKIPLSTQLQSLDPSCFIGNDLCGSPLSKNCIATIKTPDFECGGGIYGNEHEVDWFYVSMALGFMVGFWSTISPLVVNKRWRYKCYHLLDQLRDNCFSIVRKCI